MPCVDVMAGNFLMFQIIVFVDPPSVPIMQLFVDMAALLSYAIMNCGISLLPGCRKFVIM